MVAAAAGSEHIANLGRRTESDDSEEGYDNACALSLMLSVSLPVLMHVLSWMSGSGCSQNL